MKNNFSVLAFLFARISSFCQSPRVLRFMRVGWGQVKRHKGRLGLVLGQVLSLGNIV